MCRKVRICQPWTFAAAGDVGLTEWERLGGSTHVATLQDELTYRADPSQTRRCVSSIRMDYRRLPKYVASSHTAHRGCDKALPTRTSQQNASTMMLSERQT